MNQEHTTPNNSVESKTKIQSALTSFEHRSEQIFFNSRWLSAPLYALLAFMLCLITIRGLRDAVDMIRLTFTGTMSEFMLGIVEVIDLVLIGMLVTTVMFAGYENYISKMDIRSHPDYPTWLLKITFSQIKTKVTSTMTVMTGLNMFKDYYSLGGEKNINASALMFMCFVIASFVFAKMEHSHKE